MRRFPRVPGARATSVHATFWDLAFETVSRSRSNLSSLFHRICSTRGCAQQLPRREVWPMPLPFPEMHCRRARRHQKDAPRKLGLNYIVLVLNFLSAAEKPVDTDNIGLGTRLTGQQWRIVKTFQPLVDSWNSHGVVDATAMGRAAAKVESIEQLLAQLELEAQASSICPNSYVAHKAQPTDWVGVSGHPGVVVSSCSQKVEHLAKDIDAARLRFHEEPSFDPIPFLDYQNREYFSRPLDFATELDPSDPSIPRVKVRCGKAARLKLFEELDASNRLVLLPARDVRRGLECGCFAIPKDGERDRMILDARPANLCESSETRWIKSLGSLSQLHHVFLEPGKQLLVHTEDLREYYHAFLIPPQRQQRNAFKAVYRPNEVRHLKCYTSNLESEEFVVPALDTMAMGDLNSVAFGQTAHLSVILRNTPLDLDDFITLQGRPKRGTMHAGLLIDDFVLWEQVDLDADLDRPTDGSEIVDKVRSAYQKVGLPRHPGKAVSKSPYGEFWGAELDGIRGILRPNLKRLIPLAHILCRVVRCGRSSVALLEILSGSLVSAFQLRRRMMSMLHEVYAAQKGRQQSDVVSLSKELKDELLACAGLLVLCFMDLRLEASPLLLASDASSHTRAATSTVVGREATKELQKFGLQKGLWNRLLSPSKVILKNHGLLTEDDELPGEGECYESHPLWQEIACSQQFETFGSIQRGGGNQHINVLEVKAALEAEEEHGRLHPNSYYVHLVDSQVASINSITPQPWL